MVGTLIAHVFLAAILFYLVNWIGEHTADFGYGSTTLFEEPNESLALNFFIRALAPTVFIVCLSAAAVGAGAPGLRTGIYWIAVIYYLMRAAYIFASNLQRLVSWPRYFFHASVGIGAALLAYHYLILPNRSLLPDFEQAGNELWLAILAFLYAAANKVTLTGGPGDRRRNRFIKENYEQAAQDYGQTIDAKITNDTLKLITYGILVYENYCRPPIVRLLERLRFWKPARTTGVMQVASETNLTDQQSVDIGTDKLIAAWIAHADEEYSYARVRATITDYNFDEAYFSNVLEVMEIIAKRAAPQFRSAYMAFME